MSDEEKDIAKCIKSLLEVVDSRELGGIKIETTRFEKLFGRYFSVSEQKGIQAILKYIVSNYNE